MLLDDTICAPCSAAGPAVRAIVRLSGPQSFTLAAQLQQSSGTIGASHRRLRVDDLSFDAWVYAFAAPRSYTGQDVVELHIPGNPLLVRLIMEELLRLGARQAGPGEFTARAYFNGRLGLAEAEGVAATIAARSQEEATAARQLLAGELSRRLGPIMEQLASILALTEVGIDFSEEDVTLLAEEQVRSRLDEIDGALAELISTSARFERLSHEPVFVLVGRPNAGKSTLLNALCGHDRAVVSDIAGTTRDALSAEVMLERGMVRVIDVAGLDESPPRGEIDQQMRQRALRMLEEADHVILVREAGDERPPLELPRTADLVVRTKLDLHDPSLCHGGLAPPCSGTADAISWHGRLARATTGDSQVASRNSQLSQHSALGTQHLAISAHTHTNLDLLRQRMSELAHRRVAGSALALNARHLAAIDAARAALARARAAAGAGAELLALELREALDHLGGILGQITPDDVLGRIFGAFCIGK